MYEVFGKFHKLGVYACQAGAINHRKTEEEQIKYSSTHFADYKNLFEDEKSFQILPRKKYEHTQSSDFGSLKLHEHPCKLKLSIENLEEGLSNHNADLPFASQLNKNRYAKNVVASEIDTSSHSHIAKYFLHDFDLNVSQKNKNNSIIRDRQLIQNCKSSFEDGKISLEKFKICEEKILNDIKQEEESDVAAPLNSIVDNTTKPERLINMRKVVVSYDNSHVNDSKVANVGVSF